MMRRAGWAYGILGAFTAMACSSGHGTSAGLSEAKLLAEGSYEILTLVGDDAAVVRGLSDQRVSALTKAGSRVELAAASEWAEDSRAAQDSHESVALFSTKRGWRVWKRGASEAVRLTVGVAGAAPVASRDGEAVLGTTSMQDGTWSYAIETPFRSGAPRAAFTSKCEARITPFGAHDFVVTYCPNEQAILASTLVGAENASRPSGDLPANARFVRELRAGQRALFQVEGALWSLDVESGKAFEVLAATASYAVTPNGEHLVAATDEGIVRIELANGKRTTLTRSASTVVATSSEYVILGSLTSESSTDLRLEALPLKENATPRTLKERATPSLLFNFFSSDGKRWVSPEACDGGPSTCLTLSFLEEGKTLPLAKADGYAPLDGDRVALLQRHIDADAGSRGMTIEVADFGSVARTTKKLEVENANDFRTSANGMFVSGTVDGREGLYWAEL
jgi:hypothetical protein